MSKKIECMPGGMIQENTYIVPVDDVCYIIDPGFGAERIIRYVDQNYQGVKAILLTHGHFDHVGAVDALVTRYQCPVYLHPDDYSFVHNVSGHGEDLGYRTILKTPLLHPEELNDNNVIWIHTPGHSPGSGCYLFQKEKALFSGDTLFAVDIGRVDLPGGSWRMMSESLRKLKDLPDDLILYPGHEESSTVGQEKKTNQYLSKV